MRSRRSYWPLCWGLACWFINDEMCALVHLELTRVFGSVLLAQPLHLFTLRAGEACHANSAATQHGAQIVLNRQICIPEKTEGDRILSA